MAGKVLVEIKGGLGNQLFQYAAGLSLASEHGKDLVLDTRWLNIIGTVLTGTRRKLALHDLGLEVRLATKLDLILADFVRILTSSRLLAAFPGILPVLNGRGIRAFKERHFHYEPFEDSVGSFSLISGYFQSEKYFQGISATLRETIFQGLVVPHQIEKFHRSLVEDGGICVNVRRGDFVQSGFHGALDRDYYERGVAHIEARTGIKPIYIFSDDISWCSENLRFENREVRFLEHDLAGPEFTHYLFMMSLFENFVIPNSTFAWWAVWLSGKNAQIVVAPETWFLGAPTIDTSDLIPDTWIRIPNQVSRP